MVWCFLIKKFFFSFYFFWFSFFSVFFFLQLRFNGGCAGCIAGVKLFNDKLNSETIDAFVASTRAGRAFNLDATYLEKLAQFKEYEIPTAWTGDLTARVTALEGDQSSSNTNLNAILDRLEAYDQRFAAQDGTIAAQGQKIADLEAALQSKASTTYVDGKFAAVDAQLVRIEGIRRERAADVAAAAAAAAGSKTPGTAGSSTGPQAGIDDQPAAAPNPAGPATEDGNNPPGAGDGQEGPCPDQQDPPECAAMSPAGCGTLLGQTNVTAVCPNLCSADCNVAAAGTGGGDDGDEKSSTLTVGRILAIALSLVTVVVCVGVAVVSTMRKNERGRQRARTQAQRGPAATNNPTFDADDAGAYLEPSALQTEAYDDAAATRASTSSSNTVVYAVPIEVNGGGTGAEYVPDGYYLYGGGAGANNSSAAATTIVYAVPAEEDADGDGIYVPDGYPGSDGGSISMA